MADRLTTVRVGNPLPPRPANGTPLARPGVPVPPKKPLFGGIPPVKVQLPPPPPPEEPPHKRVRIEDEVDVFDGSDVDEMEIEPPCAEPTPRESDDDDDATAEKPVTAVKPATPAKRVTKLPDAFYRELITGLQGRATETSIPADALVPVAGHITEQKLSVVFIPTAAQRAKIRVLAAPPRKAASLDDYVFGVFVLSGPDVRAILPGTAVLVHPSKKADEPAARYALAVPGIDKNARPLVDEDIPATMHRIFDNMRVDHIPSLMSDANIEFGCSLYRLIEADDAIASDLAELLIPTEKTPTTPWHTVVEDDRPPIRMLIDALGFVFSYLDQTIKPKSTPRKPRVAKPAEPAKPKAPKPAEVKPAPVEQVKPKASETAKPAPVESAKPKASETAKPKTAEPAPRTDRLHVRVEPKALLDTIIVPKTVSSFVPAFFELDPTTELCGNGSLALRFGPAEVPPAIQANLQTQLLAKTAYSFVSRIRGLPVDNSGLAIDPDNLTRPVTVMNADGTTITGTYVSFETAPSPAYKLVIGLLLEAHRMWLPIESEEDDEAEEGDDDDDEDQDEDD